MVSTIDTAAERVTIQPTARRMPSRPPCAPKQRLTVNARPLFMPKAKFMPAHSAAVAPISARAAEPSRCPAKAVSVRL